MDELLDAIKQADKEKIKLLLSVQPDLVYQLLPQQGISPLMLAIYYRNKEIVALLSQFKSELNAYEASATGNLEYLKMVLDEQKIAVNSFAADGFTCLGLACFFGHFEVAKYLIAKGADVNLPANNAFKVAPIHSASAISDEKIISLLLENGVDVNAKQQNGITPLHTVAYHGQTDLVQLLLIHGADVQAKMDTGQTPLSMATEKGFMEIVDLLKK